MQTEKATKLPMSSVLKRIRTKLSLDKEGFDFNAGYQEMARILAEYGYAFYQWKPSSEKLENGPLKAGITVVKVNT